MQFRIQFETDNDSFTNDGAASGDAQDFETARILRYIANSLEYHSFGAGCVLDSNGNTIGYWDTRADDPSYNFETAYAKAVTR